jgi:hypothetical protein
VLKLVVIFLLAVLFFKTASVFPDSSARSTGLFLGKSLDDLGSKYALVEAVIDENQVLYEVLEKELSKEECKAMLPSESTSAPVPAKKERHVLTKILIDPFGEEGEFMEVWIKKGLSIVECSYALEALPWDQGFECGELYTPFCNKSSGIGTVPVISARTGEYQKAERYIEKESLENGQATGRLLLKRKMAN